MILGTVIIPAYNREDTIDRAIGSVANQGLVRHNGAWEIIAIDDKSTDKTVEKIVKWEDKFPKIVVGIKLPEHVERICGFNAGMHYARGEWIVMLDSDDELAAHFLKAFDDAVKMNPNAKVINWGTLQHFRNKDGQYIRTDVLPTYHPPLDEFGNFAVFRSGGITSGAFAFKKELLLQTGYLPIAYNPFTAGEKFIKLFPEVAALYNPGQTDLGNPWGQDWMWFYMLTRVIKPDQLVGLNQILCFKHIRP